MGNVKGTFGFVDQDGEIKRVSYSSSNNGSDTSTLAPHEKDRRVVQSIAINQKPSPTTRRPTIIYPNITPSPSSTVIQTIPRRRISTKENATTTTTTTERPSYKYDSISSQRTQSTTETTPRVLSSHQRTIYQNGHFIRSTLSPQVDVQRYTEGQLIRPTHPETVTPRPSDSYLRRLLVTRNPLLDEQISSTIKPVAEENQDNVRGNLLRRQLTQEKVTDYNTRQHIINLHQSTGNDATDVHSASLTTGTPRPLFTTTLRPRLQPSAPTTPKGIISPAKYPVLFQKNAIRGPKLLEQFGPESTTDASNIAEANYITPTPIPQIPIIQIPQDDRIQYLQGRSLPRGAFLIPVNQVQNRYMYDDQNNQDYIQQYAVPHDQYTRDDQQGGYLQPTHIPRVTPIPIIFRQPQDDRQYQRMELMPDYIRPYPVPINTNLQEDIDNIKPPVSTIDFQKLLNRLIIRQNHLKEISRLENQRMMQDPYYGPERYRLQPNPVSIFVRQRDPVQFIQRPNQRFFIPPMHPMQARMESQQYQSTEPYNPEYEPVPMYRHGRRVARLLDQNLRTNQDENYLPPDVREMLLLKMLQLAINPNLPIPPTEQELMTTANPPHRKEAVRNVQILGEEENEQQSKRSARSKRYDEASEDMEYY